MFNVKKLIDAYIETRAWIAKSAHERSIRIGQMAHTFLSDIGTELEATAIRKGTTWQSEFEPELGYDCPQVSYSLGKDESYLLIHEVCHLMVTMGWKYDSKEDAYYQRREYAFRKGDVKGVFYVYPGDSDHCRLVVDKEEPVAATTHKTYKIVCDTDPVKQNVLEQSQLQITDQIQESDDDDDDDAIPF